VADSQVSRSRSSGVMGAGSWAAACWTLCTNSAGCTKPDAPTGQPSRVCHIVQVLVSYRDHLPLVLALGLRPTAGTVKCCYSTLKRISALVLVVCD
jgi:hypothetical protein